MMSILKLEKMKLITTQGIQMSSVFRESLYYMGSYIPPLLDKTKKNKGYISHSHI